MNGNMEGVRQSMRDEFDIVLGRLVLGGLDEWMERAARAPTRAELSRILTRKPLAGNEAPAPSVEGLLDRLRVDDTRCMIEILESKGLICAAPDQPRRIVLSPEGKRYLRGFLPAPPGLVAKVLDRREPDSALYRALRALRLALAQERAVPPYRIFDNRTLRVLVARQPTTFEDLLKVPGIGPAKACRFGGEILDAVARHAASPVTPPAVTPPAVTPPAVTPPAVTLSVAGAPPASPALPPQPPATAPAAQTGPDQQAGAPRSPRRPTRPTSTEARETIVAASAFNDACPPWHAVSRPHPRPLPHVQSP